MLNTPNEQMKDEYLSGQTLQEIGTRHGVSYQTVRRRLTAMGVPLRVYTGPWGGSEPRYVVPLDHVRAMREQGCSVAEIAAAIDVPAEVVRERMVAAGIPRLEAKARPDRNWFYRSGRTWDTGGYVLILVPAHPGARANRYVAEHRLVAEAELGRYLLAREVVDHDNGNTTDNRWSNLRVFPSNAEHLRVTLGGRPKRSRRSSSFDPRGPIPSASETGAEPSLRRHPLFPFPLCTAPPGP